ncbi:aliphatic sulfonate ABC transporter substrate-binding protein [Elstera sp.]|jgi:sulfonate transport system substrate-binding protein|uniref:aliphatic sulfonate ABC transporter substrate-binding protein n=1 Tax=Elstera sp. TaxID=1916664 RepID=UPI0037BFAE19
MARTHFARRPVLAGLFALSASALALSLPAHAQDATPKEVRIGYQKSGLLILAKQRKSLEARLNPLGIQVKWAEFSFGPPLLEALGLGSVDFGTTGDAPPIFAQAAGANLLYVSAQEAAGSGAAILVAENSPIKTLADLKGKKVGFAKASSAHNLTIAALEKGGLTYQDIEPIYLPPADAAAAFARGSIDAWTIWDPYFAIAEKSKNTRILSLAKGIVTQNSFFLANKDFTAKYPEIVSAINGVLADTAKWASQDQEAVAVALADITGVDLASQRRAVARTEFTVSPVSPAVVAEQQRIADRFHRLNLIPKPIRVKDIVWTWTPAS